MNKKWTFILLCAAALALMTGCATNADVLPSPSPSLLPSPSPVITLPMATGTPMVSPMATTDVSGVMTVPEAKTVSNKIEAEVEKLSEVDTATAVAVGNMAIVGVSFDTQYKGGLTTRFTDMVKDRIGTVKGGINEVGVTNDPTIIKQIEELKKTLDDSGTSLSELNQKVSALITEVAPTNRPTTSPTV